MAYYYYYYYYYTSYYYHYYYCTFILLSLNSLHLPLSRFMTIARICIWIWIVKMRVHAKQKTCSGFRL